MTETNETELMQQNLQRMMRNQNYFSSFFNNDQKEQEPVNPFRKRMFDKKLRRSTVSCGHYNSTSQHSESRNKEQDNHQDNHVQISNNDHLRWHINQQLSHSGQDEQPLQIQRTQKITLAQSRHSSDPHKQQVTRIINNFRLQLDYLQEKLHAKVDQLHMKYADSINGMDKKDREVNFMIDSLEKIVGFMIENCVNLEENVIYGKDIELNEYKQYEYHDQPVMKRQIYQIDDDQQDERQNISFGQGYGKMPQKPQTAKKTKKAVHFKQKQNTHQNNNIPNTFYINNKLHVNQKPKSNIRPVKDNSKLHRQEDNEKPTNRGAQSKYRSNKPTVSKQNDSNYQNSRQNHSYNNYASCALQNHHPNKSVYETVLEEREMRIKMKKRMV